MERNKLLDQLRLEEAEKNKECEVHQKLLDKISAAQEKVIEGRKNKEEL